MKIEQVNKLIKECHLCPGTQCVSGSGSINPRLMFIFLGPPPDLKDIREDLRFKALKEILIDVDVPLRKCYFTYLVKAPCKEQYLKIFNESCSETFSSELKMVNPEIILPIGSKTSEIITDYFKDSSDPEKISRETAGGLRFISGWRVFSLPIPDTPYQDEFRKLSVLKRYCRWHNSCPMRRFDDQGRIQKFWRLMFCTGDWETCTRFRMESAGAFHPDHMLPDGSLDESLKDSE